MALKINRAKLKVGLLLWLEREHKRWIFPTYKATVDRAAKYLVEGGVGYQGTPQHTGNAVANWFPSADGPTGQYIDLKGYFEAVYSSSEDPNEEAMHISLQRVRDFLSNLGGNFLVPIKVTLENNTPYLFDFRPYGGQRVFRAENLWPIGVERTAQALKMDVNAGRLRNMT